MLCTGRSSFASVRVHFVHSKLIYRILLCYTWLVLSSTSSACWVRSTSCVVSVLCLVACKVGTKCGWVCRTNANTNLKPVHKSDLLTIILPQLCVFVPCLHVWELQFLASFYRRWCMCTGPSASAAAAAGSSSRGGRSDTREWSRPGLSARQMNLSKPKTLRVS